MLQRMRLQPFTILIIMLMLCGAARSAVLFQQTVRVGDLKATVSIYKVMDPNNPLINVTFSTTGKYATYPIACLSIYQDVRYELRDNAGRLIPISQAALARPAPQGRDIANHVVAAASRSHVSASGCKDANNTSASQDTFILTLYPDIRTGRYTLWITVAPRLSSARVRLNPFEFTIQR